MSTSSINLPKKFSHLNMNQYIKKWDCFQLSGLSCPVTVWFSISINREVDIATIQLNWTENQCIDASFFSLHIAYTLYWTYKSTLLYFIEKNNNAIIIVIVLALCFYCFNFVRCFGWKHLLNQGFQTVGHNPRMDCRVG